MCVCGGGGVFIGNAVASIISWSKYIKLGMVTDNFKEHQIFVQYASDITGSICEGLYVYYTMKMNTIELPSHFMRAQNVMAVFTAAQNMALSILRGKSKL